MMTRLFKNRASELEKALGYKFKNKDLLAAALTHRSYRFETSGEDRDNERLEFLGDSAIGLVTADYLFHKYGELDEGTLTLLKSRLTNTRALAKVAASIGLGERIMLGKGELKTGGRKRTSTVANAMEAVLGAVYLDGGIRAVERILKRLFVPVITVSPMDTWSDNPKGKLQSMCQRIWKTIPAYEVVKEEGKPHQRVYTVEVKLGDDLSAHGTGKNKRAAETEAAKKALDLVAEYSKGSKKKR